MNTKPTALLLIISISAIIVNTNAARHPDCLLPLETGLCRGGFTLWGFDTATSKCVEFPYGGCNGNANGFATEEICNAKCEDKPVSAKITKETNDVPSSCSGKCVKCSKSPNIIRT